MRTTGSSSALPHSGGSKPTLDLDDKTALYMHAQLFPVATLKERQLFMCGLRGKLASIATLCKTLQKLGFSRKIAQYYSRNRDQLSRARWFSRGPAYAQGRHAYGVFGVPTSSSWIPTSASATSIERRANGALRRAARPRASPARAGTKGRPSTSYSRWTRASAWLLALCAVSLEASVVVAVFDRGRRKCRLLLKK